MHVWLNTGSTVSEDIHDRMRYNSHIQVKQSYVCKITLRAVTTLIKHWFRLMQHARKKLNERYPPAQNDVSVLYAQIQTKITGKRLSLYL